MRKENGSQWTFVSMQENIERAHSLYSSCGRSLKQDPSIRALLHRLQRYIDDSKNTMCALGVVAECKHCEEQEGGSCCGAGIENRYDEVLLLINLLLGGSLQIQGHSGNSCSFLGEHGCTLMARHVLCVNYICDRLQKKLTRDELIGLQNCSGKELDTLFILHDAIKKHIRT